MKDYNDFPPLKYFIRVLKSCPKSALLYVELWKKKGRHLSISIRKNNVRREFFISPTLFRNLLAPLMFLNLISFVEGDDSFQIDMMGNINE